MNSTDLSSKDRRSVLKATGALVFGASLAGCSSSSDGGDGGSDGGDSGGDGDGGDSSGDGDSGGSDSFDGWMEDVDNYEGVTDETGADEVTVKVGAKGNGGNLAFEPAGIKISSGTTVLWEWTGEGGSHDVVEQDETFKSELVNEEGHTFEYTFDNTGTYKYFCTPHKAMGMKGVVVVE